MSAKKLDQSVFEGLPSEYRWAVTDFCGEVFALSGEKPELNAQKNDWHFCGKDYLLILCKYGDATDWKNSLIERQDVPTAADIDWNSAPEGTTHAIYEHDFVLWLQQQPSGSWLGQTALGDFWDKLSGEPEGFVFKRPESITDVAATNFADVRVDVDTMAAQSSFDAPILNFGNLRYPFNQTKEQIQEVARSIEAARVAEREFKAKPCPHGCIAATIEQIAMPYPDGDARYFETSDVVNNPAHYTTGGIECIDAMQAMLSREELIGYLRGNIFKYQWRYKHKNGVEDLRKADWYARRLIEIEGAK